VTVPAVPKGTGRAGRELWRSVMGSFVLDDHERTLLEQAVAVADTCADLQAVVDRDGPLVRGPDGMDRAHAALVELRQQRILLARLIVALRIPLGDEEQEGRTPRRALRGVYGIRSGGAA